MNNKKIKKISIKTLLILFGIILGAGLTVFAATGEWKGTDRMRGGEIVMAYDIWNNFEFLKSKIKKYSCPEGEAIQELDLNAGTFKCTGAGKGSSGSNCSTVVNKCNNNAAFQDLPDNSSAYRWKCGAEDCSKTKVVKRYQSPTIIETGLSYKCIGGLEECLVIGKPGLKNCLQAGANDKTGSVCTTSRTICKTSFSGPIWGNRPAGNTESCIKGTGVNSERLWLEQGSKPASWCKGRLEGTNNWIRDNVVSVYNQECR